MSVILQKHQKKVNRLVKSSIAFTFFFGINSVLYINSQNNFKELLSEKEAIRAIKISSDIDQISFKTKIKAKSQVCADPFSDFCQEYLITLIQLKNRIYDYQMIFNNVFEYQKDSEQIKTLNAYENKLDLLIGDYFGLNPKGAQKKGIQSVEQYIEFLNSRGLIEKNTSKRKDIVSQILYTTNQTYAYLNNTVSLIEKRTLKIEDSNLRLKYILYGLIFLQILVFILVNYIDLINNNFDKDSDSINDLLIK
tara:strand:+ start:932 stop:1684 length:753 start_codon:yes stop_codon:yes gene_type:complete